MSDQKLIDLEGGKTLYNDLRGRVEGQSVPKGGSPGQVLTKVSGKDYAAKWKTPVDSSGEHFPGTNFRVDTSNNSFGGAQNATAEGVDTIASGDRSHAEGYGVTSSGDNSHAEGFQTTASGDDSHAEGHATTASELASHAEGYSTVANGEYAHSEGSNTVADGNSSHAQGLGTIVRGESASVLGKYNVLDDAQYPEWVAGTSYAVGDKVKKTSQPLGVVTYYVCTVANNDIYFYHDKWAERPGLDYAEIVGNGTADNARSNAYALTWTGDGHYAGDVYVHSNADSTGGTKLATINDIPSVPVQDVQVNGVSVVSSGVANVPKASSSVVGVVSIGNGLMINQNGAVMVEKAIDANIKAGTHQYLPIVPYNQHSAVFYGLAKAAGADMSSSDNAVGTYTDAAKTAIKNMIGVEEGLKVVRLI